MPYLQIVRIDFLALPMEPMMIRHIVLTQFPRDTPEPRIADIYAALASLTSKLPGAHAFTAGPSNSPENLERGYTHGFTIDFDSWADLETYATHPDHKELGAQLTTLAVGGIDGVLVMDLEV